MGLPKIIPTRLQRVVADLEFSNSYDDLDALCEAVAEHQWAQGLNLKPKTIGELIVYHETITKVAKPVGQDADTGSVSAKPKPIEEDEHEPTQSSKPAQPVATSVKTFDGPGRGRKQCPECNAYVGVRTPQCNCGHAFGAKPKSSSPPLVRDEMGERPRRSSFDPRQLVIIAPAGACPHKLTSTERDDVEEWAEKVREYGVDHNRFFTIKALAYFARQFYELFTPEHDQVKAHLQDIYAEEIVPTG